MSNYLEGFGTRVTPQTEPIPGSAQVENSAGGFVYGVDCWTRMNRFLILGSEGGSYYASERALTVENAAAVADCLAEDGPRAVRVIVYTSVAGRAPKNDPAIFALAMACSVESDVTRKLALAAIPDVCRIGTHLFHFATYVEQFRGWGRGLRNAIAQWYLGKDPDALAYQIIKYRQRDGWSHRDLLRLAHPYPESVAHGNLFRYVTLDQRPANAEVSLASGVSPAIDAMMDQIPDIIVGFEQAQGAQTPAESADLVRRHKLPREALRTDHLNSIEVWDALLPGMPLTALIRNLATMTRVGLLAPMSEATATVVARLSDAEGIHKARVHPISILSALMTYKGGVGVRGTNAWAPVAAIVDALDAAFYLSFDNVPQTGKRWLLGLDISGSMWGGQIAGIPGLTPAIASAAMAMVTARGGDPYEVVAFTSERNYYAGDPAPMQIFNGLSPMTISPRQRLDDVLTATRELSRHMGRTDCSLPMQYATAAKRDVDVFAIYTDSETYAGRIHPSQALNQYRHVIGHDAKLIVVGMVSNGFSIADPADAGMLDVVGFGTDTPAIMSGFAKGEI